MGRCGRLVLGYRHSTLLLENCVKDLSKGTVYACSITSHSSLSKAFSLHITRHGVPVFATSNRSFPGTAPIPDQNTTPFFTQNTGIGNPARDSEYKLLDYAALSGDPSAYNNLYTELPPCDSCNGVIDQFKFWFNPDLQVTWGPFDDPWPVP